MSYFWPESVENRAAIRTAIAALVAVLISFTFHLQTPYWSGMTVIMVANLYTGSIIDKATLRIIGTLAGAFLGFYLAGIVANSFLLYILSCFLIITISVYYYHFSNYGYAYLLGALCAFIIVSQVAVNPQNAFLVAIWRPVEIGIGVLVAAISAYVIFPNHLKDNITSQVQDLFNDYASLFNELQRQLASGAFNTRVLEESNLKVKKKLRKATELIGAMNHEVGVTQERADELRALLNSFNDLSRQFQFLMLNTPTSYDLEALATLPLEPLFIALNEDLHHMQSYFSKNSHQALKSNLVLTELETAFNQKEIKYRTKNDFTYSLMHFFNQITQSFTLMHSLLMHKPVAAKHKINLIDRQDRLRSDADLVKHSIKAGLAVILALGFWLISNWPGGINGIISSLIISVRKNLFDMKSVSIHRLLGCFLGGGIALMALFLLALTLSDFIIIVFFAVWGLSYFMFKYPKYAYIGLQANVALIITLAQEGGPPIHLDPPLQRLGGIVIGIVASFIVANILWRSDVWTIINRYLDKLYRYICFNLKEVLIDSDEKKSLHDLANLFWLTRGLIESLEDKVLSLKKQHLLGTLRQRFESLVVLQATLSHILISIDRRKAEITANLLNYNLVEVVHKLVLCFETRDANGGLIVAQSLTALLTRIEHKRKDLTINDLDLRHLIAYANALIQLAKRI